MNRLVMLLCVLLLTGCGRSSSPSQGKGSPGDPGNQPEAKTSLPEARRGFQTKLARKESAGRPLPPPPPDAFQIVHYDAPPGKLAAYLTPAPKDGKKQPAIIWITGGDCNTVGNVWSKRSPKNDQSASAFREAGIVMLFPSLRGGNENPGLKEGFFGEVDDVLAAADFLAKQEFVDPQRLYLGGHSTGGTLVFLVAACTDRFRAVFSFGPVHDVRGYSSQFLPFNTSDSREFDLRAPGQWTHSVRCPVFVFEGINGGNIGALNALIHASHNPLVHVHPVKGHDHFTLLHPLTRLIAGKILRDEGATTNLAFAEGELNNLGK
jgi:acetyl esterase/lipase